MSGVWRCVKRHALTAYALFAVGYLLLPIAVVILFSFNSPEGRFNYVWQGFTFDNWLEWDAVLGLRDAVVLSLQVGLLATLVATVLGTLIALAIVRHHFVGRGATNLLVFLPMSTPEIVLGASLLALFLNTTAVFQLGFWTIFIAHVMFIVSFIVVTVKARLIGFDRHLEEAAMDLGANELVTFRKVTLPLIAPAMLAAALLGFALSIDDFVITYLRRRARADVPGLRLGSCASLRAAAGERRRERDLPRRHRHRPRQRRLAVPSSSPSERSSRMNVDLQQAARDHLWLHFTRMGGYRDADVPIIVRGDGCYLEDVHGTRYLDALAGLFSVNIGYSFGEEIGQAALAQMRELPFYTNWSYSHPRAIELAEEVASLAPGDLNRVFFVSGGSEAVESAWKLARQFHVANGAQPGFGTRRSPGTSRTTERRSVRSH